MNRRELQLAIVCLLCWQVNVFAQAPDLPKYEVAAEFTTLERDAFSRDRLEAGFGGRFTYNLNRSFALEAAGYFFPKRCFDCRENGRMTQVVAGVKAGKRFDTWGVFAKARPGFATFSEGETDAVLAGPNTLAFQQRRVTGFATDIGGVLEFYPSKRIVTRFDAGDTMIFFRDRVKAIPIFSQPNGPIVIIPAPRPARTSHHFQFTASVGFRF